MFSSEMQRIYKRLMILGLLLMCLFYFGYSEQVERVSAAACLQDCEASENDCRDSCRTSCSADMTDEDCNSCVQFCNTQFRNCASHAIYCRDIDSPPEPECSIGYADHCPVIGGSADCTPGHGIHSGYYAICNTIGGQQCVSCPDHEFCVGANGLPPCF